MRKLLRALILESFYLAALILSFDAITAANGVLFIKLYGGDVVPASWGLFLPIMTFAPCLLSIILESLACRLARKQVKTENSL